VPRLSYFLGRFLVFRGYVLNFGLNNITGHSRTEFEHLPRRKGHGKPLS